MNMNGYSRQQIIDELLPFLKQVITREQYEKAGEFIDGLSDYDFQQLLAEIVYKAKEAKVTAALGSGTDSKEGSTTTQGTQATTFSSLSEADVVKSVGTLSTADQKKSGILASVSMAQFILESGYGKRSREPKWISVNNSRP